MSEIDEAEERAKALANDPVEKDFKKFVHAIYHNEPLQDEDIPSAEVMGEIRKAINEAEMEKVKEAEAEVDAEIASLGIAEEVRSQAEAEKRQIYGLEHYEATPEELDKMTPDQYKVWREQGSHMKPIKVDTTAEDEAKAQELKLIDSMTVAEYAAYREARIAAARAKEVAEREQRAAFEKERLERLSVPKTVEEMDSMGIADYIAWRNNQNNEDRR